MNYNSYNSNGSQSVGGMTPPPIPPLPEGYSQIQSTAPQENIQMEAEVNQNTQQESIQMEAEVNQNTQQESIQMEAQVNQSAPQENVQMEAQVNQSAPQENAQMDAQTNQYAPQENIQMEAQENQCVSQENPQTPPAQEPAKEVEIKKVAVQGGELCMGDYCYARTPLDGLYYFAQIKSFGDTAVNVCFFNGYEASLPFKNVYTVVEAANEMQVFGNARGKGKFFAAKLVEQTPNGFVVCYDDSNLKESLAYAQLRFAVK